VLDSTIGFCMDLVGGSWNVSCLFTGKVYDGVDSLSLDLLNVAVYSTCNSTLSNLFLTNCQSAPGFYALAACILDIDNTSSLVQGNSPLSMRFEYGSFVLVKVNGEICLVDYIALMNSFVCCCIVKVYLW